MIINLFDANFAHDVCSIAGKTPKHVQYVRGLKEWDGITVFTDSYLLDEDLIRSVKSRYKFGWMHEPECLWPDNYKLDGYQLGLFDFVMTYHEPLLNQYWQGNRKYLFSPYGGVWIPREFWATDRPYKPLNLSMLYGSKLSARGHQIRHEIGDIFSHPDWGIDFYGHKGTPTNYGWRTKDIVLSPYKFSIVCETCKQDNLFTEILLDCFAAATVPIFWGAPNIGEFFDSRGIISFDKPEDLASILPELGSKLYHEMFPYVERNRKLVEEYEITEDWQYKNIYRGLL